MIILATLLPLLTVNRRCSVDYILFSYVVAIFCLVSLKIMSMYGIRHCSRYLRAPAPEETSSSCLSEIVTVGKESSPCCLGESKKPTLIKKAI